jgi:hypothetical protein
MKSRLAILLGLGGLFIGQGKASIAFTAYVDGTVVHSVSYLPGNDITVVNDAFIASTVGDFPDLSGQSGTVTLNLAAPDGRLFVTLEDLTAWHAGLWWSNGSPFVGGPSIGAPTQTLTDLTGSAIYDFVFAGGDGTGGGQLNSVFAASGPLVFGTPGSFVMSAGTTFSGWAATYQVSDFSGYSAFGGLTPSGTGNPAFHYFQFTLVLEGDQTATAPAQLVALSEVPEPTTWLLSSAGLSLLLLRLRTRRNR